MPAYNIKAPNGKTYRVEGPDQQGALMALRKALGSGQTPEANPPPLTGMQQAGDVLSSFGSGLVRGVGDVVGMPGDLFAATNQALDTAYNYATGEDYHTPMPKYLPTSQAAKDLASKVTGVTLPTPQTTGGKIAEKAGEFMTGAKLLGAKPIDTIKYGAVPGIVSEGAGQAAEAYGASKGVADAARVVGGFAGLGGAALRPSIKAPPVGALAAKANELYAASEAQGIAIKPSALVKMANDVDAAFKSGGGGGVASDQIYKGATAAMQEVMDAATAGKPITLRELDRLRQVVRDAGKSGSPADQALAGKMKAQIDNFINGMSQADVVSGNAAAGVQNLKDARLLWTQKSKGETIDDIIANAELTAAGDAGKKAQALRAGFRTLAKSDEFKFFSPREQAAIRDAASSSAPEKVANWLSKFALSTNPWGSGTAAGILGYSSGNPMLAGTVPVAGEAGRLVSNAIAARDANIAAGLAKGGTVRRVPRGMTPLVFNIATQPPEERR